MNTYRFVHRNSSAVLILSADDVEEAWGEFENIIQIEKYYWELEED